MLAVSRLHRPELDDRRGPGPEGHDLPLCLPFQRSDRSQREVDEVQCRGDSSVNGLRPLSAVVAVKVVEARPVQMYNEGCRWQEG